MTLTCTDHAVCRRMVLLCQLNVALYSKDRGFTTILSRHVLTIQHMRQLMAPVPLPPHRIEEFLLALNEAGMEFGVGFARHGDAKIFLYNTAWVKTVHNLHTRRVLDQVHMTMAELELTLNGLIQKFPAVPAPTSQDDPEE